MKIIYQLFTIINQCWKKPLRFLGTSLPSKRTNRKRSLSSSSQTVPSRRENNTRQTLGSVDNQMIPCCILCLFHLIFFPTVNEKTKKMRTLIQTPTIVISCTNNTTLKRLSSAPRPNSLWCAILIWLAQMVLWQATLFGAKTVNWQTEKGNSPSA